MKKYRSNYTCIVPLENEYAISLDQNSTELLKTPSGSLIKHDDESFLQHMISELEQFPILETKDGALIDEQLGYVTFYSLYAGLIDFIIDSPPPSFKYVFHCLSNDPLLHASAGPEQTDQLRSWEPMWRYIHALGVESNPLMSTISNEPEFYGNIKGNDGSQIDFRRFVQIIQNDWASLAGPQLLVMNVLMKLFGSALAALCFVKSSCTSNEFAHAVLAGSLASYTFGGFSDEEDDIGPEELHRGTYKEALEIAGVCEKFIQYLVKPSALLELIEAGENRLAEFKSTLRWNIKAERNDDAITHASIKTIAAFLNTDGGRLIIGVDDDGKVLGLELDRFPNEDKFMLYLMNLVKSQLGQSTSSLVNPTMHTFNKKKVCVVECNPSAEPVFLKTKKNKDGEYYIRTGPGSTKLAAEDMIKYIKHHFDS